jgi:hypothetical protein
VAAVGKKSSFFKKKIVLKKQDTLASQFGHKKPNVISYGRSRTLRKKRKGLIKSPRGIKIHSKLNGGREREREGDLDLTENKNRSQSKGIIHPRFQQTKGQLTS